MAKMLIDDGFTQRRKIAARGDAPSFAIEYRQCLPEATFEYMRARAVSPTGKEIIAAVIDLIDGSDKRLVAWDVQLKDGSPAPITPDNLKRMPHSALIQIGDCITGYSPEDSVADVKN